MSKKTLIDADYITSEIADMEDVLVPQAKELAAEFKQDFDRIIGYVTESHNKREATTLTFEQVSDLIGVMSKYQQNTRRFWRGYEFTILVYRNLMKDRRWIIASKLNILKKKF